MQKPIYIYAQKQSCTKTDIHFFIYIPIYIHALCLMHQPIFIHTLVLSQLLFYYQPILMHILARVF